MAGKNVELATAYLALVPTIKGAQGAIAKELTAELGGVDKSFAAAGTKSAKSFSERLKAGIAGPVGDMAKGFAAAFAVSNVVSFFGDAIKGASDLNESAGKIETVFGSGAQSILDFTKTAAKNLGLSDNAARDAAGTLGTFGKAAGLAGGDLADFTTELLQLGGDLSAFSGGTAEEAVGAIGAALRGESEPLRRYGVLLDDAKVKAKAMEMGLYAGTGALTTNAKVLATQALILEQTTDAQGNYAATSGDLAQQQKSLTAEFANAQAEIGQALLPAMNGLVSLVRDVGVPALGFFGDALSGITNFVGDLPAPVQAAVIALGGIALLKGPLGDAFSSITSGFDTMRLQGMLAADSFRAAGGGMSGLSSVARSVGTSLGGVGKNLLAAVGGPVGVAVTLAITAITFGFSKLGEAQRRHDEINKKSKDSVNSLAESLRNGADATDASTRALALSALQTAAWGRESTDITDLAARIGVSVADLINDMLGYPGAAEKVNAALATQREALQATMDAAAAYTESGTLLKTTDYRAAEEELRILNEQAAAYGGLAGASESAAAANKLYNEATAPVAEITKSAATGIADLTEEQKKAYDAVGVSITENTSMAHSLDAIESSARLADRALDSFRAVIDGLSGRQRTSEEAAIDWNKAIDDSAIAAKNAATAKDLDRKALSDWNITALSANDTGRDTINSVNGLADAYTGNVAATYSTIAATGNLELAQAKARAMADTMRAQFVEAAKQFGLTGTEATLLADKLGIVEGTKLTDKQFAIIANDQSAQATLQNVQIATIDGKTVFIDTETKEYYESIAALTAARTAATVVVGADIDPAAATTGDFVPPPATIVTDANTAFAAATIGMFDPESKSIATDADLTRAIFTVSSWVPPTVNIPTGVNLFPPYLAIQQWVPPEVTLKVKVDPSGWTSWTPPPKSSVIGTGGSFGGAVGFGDAGGATYDWGSYSKDDQPWLLHRGEHILDASDVRAMGGQQAVYDFRSALHSDTAAAAARSAVVVRIEGDGELAQIIRRNARVVVDEAENSTARRLVAMR